MNSFQSLLKPFGESIFAKVSALRNLTLTKSQRSRFLESISDDIKKCSNFADRQVSSAAHATASSLGVDLREQSWHDQLRFDARRQVFHFEHMQPVSVIRQQCLDARSATEVAEILIEQLRVVWILKEEDRKLSEAGFRSKRSNPDAAYESVGIVLLELS